MNYEDMPVSIFNQYLLLFLLFLIVCFDSIGQKRKSILVRERRPYISFGLGRSVPIFDKLAAPEDSLSFAKPGIDVNCESTLTFTPFYSIKFSGGGVFNAIDLQSYGENLKATLASKNFSGRYDAKIGDGILDIFLWGLCFPFHLKR